MEKKQWADTKWAHADLRVLLDASDDSGLACHVGIYFRTITWNGHKVHVAGIGGVATREDCRRRGYASLALDAAVHTIRANDAVKFAILFCEPHNFAFYQARGWHPFAGEVRRTEVPARPDELGAQPRPHLASAIELAPGEVVSPQ